jgi:hypothetical protein
MGVRKVNQYLDEMLLCCDSGVKIEFDQMDRGFRALLEKELGKSNPLIDKYMEMRNKLDSSFNAQDVGWREKCRRDVYNFLKGKV